MLEEALLVLVYIALVVFIIALTVFVIRLVGTLSKVDKLLDNVTRKAESLDGLFNMIDYTTSKFGVIGETVSGYLMNFVKKLFKKSKKYESEEEDYE